jgi:predicted NUDIX family NTP pyrophosphohydrolase
MRFNESVEKIEEKEQEPKLKKQILAGVLLYKIENGEIFVYLVKSGAPWHKTRKSTWSISKGKLDKNENIIEGAVREAWEETGAEINPKEFKELGSVNEIGEHPVTKEKLDKTLYIFAQYYDKEMEYESPINERPYKGETVRYPEIEESRWFPIEEAYNEIRPVQIPFLDRLKELVNKS